MSRIRPFIPVIYCVAVSAGVIALLLSLQPGDHRQTAGADDIPALKKIDPPSAATDTAGSAELPEHGPTQPVSSLMADAMDAKVQAMVAAASVRIVHNTHGFLGCGVIVSSSSNGFDVLTANHVVEITEGLVVECLPTDVDRGQTPEQRFAARQFRTLRVVMRDPQVDLALLRIVAAEPPSPGLRLAGKESVASTLHTPTWAVHWTEPDSPTVEPVRVVARQKARRSEWDEPVSFWRIDRASEPGMSGSGLIDSFGRLLGIASGNSKGAAFYCDTGELLAFYTKAGLNSGLRY